MGGERETVCVERRRHERTALERPCKVLHAPTLRYMVARTRDLSPGGALLEVCQQRRLGVGDRVDILVDWASRGLVNRETMLGARIVRLGDCDGDRQQIGVAFERELAVTLAA